jgi:hypothetical protein
VCVGNFVVVFSIMCVRLVCVLDLYVGLVVLISVCLEDL